MAKKKTKAEKEAEAEGRAEEREHNETIRQQVADEMAAADEPGANGHAADKLEPRPASIRSKGTFAEFVNDDARRRPTLIRGYQVSPAMAKPKK